MNIKKLFRSYKRKMLFESFLKSLLFSTAAGASVLFLLSVVYHIMVRSPDLILFMSCPGGVFLISFILVFFIKYYPNNKKIARRIDEVGLHERIGTMLEYKDEGTDVANLQRQDALTHLGKTTPKQVRMRITKRSLFTCLACIVLAVCVCLVPYDLFAVEVSAAEHDAEREQMIKDLLAELREKAQDETIDDELQSAIEDIIDKMEEDLNNSTSDLEDGAIIEDAKDKIQDLIDKAISKDEIGEALQHYELTQPLGEAISKGNTEKVTTALDELEAKLTEDNTLIATLSENIFSALEDSGIEAGDDLFDSLYTFAEELSSLSERALSGEDTAADMTASFDAVEAAIIAALEAQAALEEKGEEFGDMLDDAKDEALGNEKEESEEPPEGENPEGEPPEGEKPEGEQPEGEMPEGERPEGEMPEGEAPEGEMPEGSGDGSSSNMTEGIYDPVSGNVSYGEVFAAYYAEYLQALADGTVTEEMQDIMNAYFESLNK